jgi:hypothetical protein
LSSARPPVVMWPDEKYRPDARWVAALMVLFPSSDPARVSGPLVHLVRSPTQLAHPAPSPTSRCATFADQVLTQPCGGTTFSTPRRSIPAMIRTMPVDVHQPKMLARFGHAHARLGSFRWCGNHQNQCTECRDSHGVAPTQRLNVRIY